MAVSGDAVSGNAVSGVAIGGGPGGEVGPPGQPPGDVKAFENQENPAVVDCGDGKGRDDIIAINNEGSNAPCCVRHVDGVSEDAYTEGISVSAKPDMESRAVDSETKDNDGENDLCD